MSDLPVTRIAVVGIGSAGLAQLKQARDAFARPEVAARTRLELVGFEARDDVGGLWNYDPNPQRLLHSVQPDGPEGAGQTYMYPAQGENPTPFYDNLRATLPHDLMSFRGFTFPENTPEIPWGIEVLWYLQAYATEYDLRQYTRCNTRVERLYLTPDISRPGARRWTLQSSGPDGSRVEEFDFVSVNNGHYSDTWIPPTPGLSTFPGDLLHSREYRRPTDYTGQTVLVVGAGNSGADIVRQISSLNIGLYDAKGSPLRREGEGDDVTPTPARPFTTVYQSSTGGPSRSGYNTGEEPWAKFIHPLPLIDHIDAPPNARIHFQGGTRPPLELVDTIIYATGYNNSLPFCKATDEPWRSRQVLEATITAEERQGGDAWETGGLKGLHMTGLDELLLFLEGDRTIAFPGLPYQIVPFPFSEVQARLAALLWAGLLPNFPDRPNPPPNPFVLNSFPYLTPPATPPVSTAPARDTTAAATAGTAGTVATTARTTAATAVRTTADVAASVKAAAAAATTTATATATATPTSTGDEPQAIRDVKPTRISERARKELIFAIPYEFDYTEYAFELMREADGGDEVEGYWKEVEAWRRDRRRDTGLRKRLLGY